MSRCSVAILLFAVASTMLACKRDNKPEPLAAGSASVNPYAIDDDDVPTSVDFEEEAEKQITPENVEAEVAKMEKDLE
jgi:hypothetical protein